jgi:hypothetical protein
MSVYYFNGSPIAAPLTIKSNEPTFDVDTISLAKQRSSQGSQRWELSFNVLTADNAMELFMSGINKTGGTGFTEAASMIMPQIASNGVTVAGSNGIVTNAFSSAHVSQVDIDMTSGTGTTNTGTIKRGYFIKFGNHSKIYVVTEDCTLAGPAPTLKFYPNLVNSVITATTVLIGDSVTLSYWRDISDIKGITFSDGILSSPGTINLVESV